MSGYVGGSDRGGLSRSVTAMGTAGEMGQLFTVYEKNWNCPDCSQENYASVPKCFRCKRKKPAHLAKENMVVDSVVETLRSGGEIDWMETIDPNSYQVYYYNKKTGVTQWERPPELGAAPMATGNLFSVQAKNCVFIVIYIATNFCSPKFHFEPRLLNAIL